MDLRKLDALIATQIMGLTVLWEEHPEIVYKDLKHYSTDIAAAWEVVEKLTSDESTHIEISPSAFHKEYDVSIKFDDKDGDEYGPFYFCEPTLPLAICLAALKAVGVSID